MNNNRQRDELYRTPLADIGGFRFDEHVVEVFPDMLVRSVPGYRSIIAQSGLLAERFAQAGTHCYDLGCSLGATLLAMRHAIGERDCHLVGVDNSSAMLAKCQELIALDDQQWNKQSDLHTADNTEGEDIKSTFASPAAVPARAPAKVSLINADIAQIELQPASVVAMNFTLQFIKPGNRDELLAKIAAATVQGGALVLSEKVEFDDPVLNELYIDRYHAFKRANGYSELEVSQKRSALEKVLIPDTIETHTRRLEKAGFSHCSVWFQCFNFVSMIAVK